MLPIPPYAALKTEMDKKIPSDAVENSTAPTIIARAVRQ